MKTKRRAWVVAGVVVMLAAAVSVPFWESAWFELAYQQRKLPSVGWHYFEQRVDWLPGPAHIVPAQQCPRCREGVHRRCGTIQFHELSKQGYPRLVTLGGASMNVRILEIRFSPGVGMGFHCTCAHPSHKDKP